MKRLWALGAPLLAGAFVLLATPSRVAADASQPPVATNWSPQSVTANGQPLRIVIVGSNLSGVTQVFTNPIVTPRAVAVVSDQAVVVQLPGSIEAGEYDIELSGPSGSTVPGSITLNVLAAAPTEPPAPAGGQGSTQPQASLLPAPVAADATPAAQAAAPSSRQAPATAAAQAAVLTNSPFFALAVGIAVGGMLYVLWGKEGRLRVARRRGFLAQIWARPVQRLKLGRICMQCGRLHYAFRTRRDLWRAGQFCSATCFVASQEQELEFASSTGLAPSRLRGVGVYADMETSLQAVLRAEAAAVSGSLFAAENAPGVPPVPDWPETSASEPVTVPPAGDGPPPRVAGVGV